MTSDQRNWLERVSNKIPGYTGYVDRERRRDIDKLHRDHLADRLRSLKAPLTDYMRELTSGGRLIEIGPVDSAIKKIDQLENRIRFASYGYGGFFDVVKIEQQQLDSLYRFDLGLVEQIEKIEAAVKDFKGQAGTADGLKAAVAQVAGAVEEAGRSFDERFRAINDFNPEQPPGRPLFG